MFDPEPEGNDEAPQSPDTIWRGYMVSFVLILGVYQILFAYRVLIDNGIDADAVQFPMIWQAMIAISWSILFAYAGYRIIRKRADAVRQGAWLIIAFILIHLLQTVWFVQADYERNRVVFLLVITSMILITPIIALWQSRRQGTS